MGTNNHKARHRIQLTLGEDAYSDLSRSRETSGEKSDLEFVKNAIRLYKWYIKSIKEGDNRLLIARQGEDKASEVHLLFE